MLLAPLVSMKGMTACTAIITGHIFQNLHRAVPCEWGSHLFLEACVNPAFILAQAQGMSMLGKAACGIVLCESLHLGIRPALEWTTIKFLCSAQIG
jgi:hypothetical protein